MSCIRCKFSAEKGYYCWLKDLDTRPKNKCKDYKVKHDEDDK